MRALSRGILFSAPMVLAILDGRKTQTRRPIIPAPAHRIVSPRVGITVGMDPADDGAIWYDSNGIEPGRPVRCRYGRIGERLWVRETHALEECTEPMPERRIVYRADRCSRWIDAEGALEPASYLPSDWEPRTSRWRPSIHMPRWASRIELEITDIRAQRLEEITEAEAIAEGVEEFRSIRPRPRAWRCSGRFQGQTSFSARFAFETLWDSINQARGFGWSLNPWVWAISFRRIDR